jgi:hypothetical protein
MAFKMNPISPLLKSIGHQTPQAIKPAVSSPAKQATSLDPNNTASVTSVSTIKSSKKGDKSKLKRKETSVVVSTGAYSKKRVSKTETSNSLKDKRGKLKRKSVTINDDGTGTVSTSSLRNPAGRTRTIKNKKKAARKYDRVAERFQSQVDKKAKKNS